MSAPNLWQVEFEMRRNFAQSLAAINSCHYMLGIGDRHLLNLLLLDGSGTLCSIDFGHAFGSATQLLPIPELMPFRLTTQLLGVLQPLDAEGLLKRTMTHVMTALRKHKQILKETMSIFIKDPTLDWRQQAKKQMKSVWGGKAENEIEWATKIKEKVLLFLMS